MIARLIIRLLINAAALAAAAHFVRGIHFEGFESLAVMAVVFGLVNALIRPIVMALSCPLLILTLGLFTFVVNAAMLYLSGALTSLVGLDFRVDGFGPAFWGGLIVSLVSFVLSLLLHPSRDRETD